MFDCLLLIYTHKLVDQSLYIKLSTTLLDMLGRVSFPRRVIRPIQEENKAVELKKYARCG